MLSNSSWFLQHQNGLEVCSSDLASLPFLFPLCFSVAYSGFDSKEIVLNQIRFDSLNLCEPGKALFQNYSSTQGLDRCPTHARKAMPTVTLGVNTIHGHTSIPTFTNMVNLEVRLSDRKPLKY